VFDTKIPQTRSFLEGVSSRYPYEFFDFHRLHIAADARTVQNEVPLFLGKPFDFGLAHRMVLNKTCPVDLMLDEAPPLWARLKSIGYRSAYAATHCNGIFGYRRCPGLESSFDHLAPFPHDDEMCKKSLNPDEMYPFTFMCKGPHRVFEHYHRYFEQFFRQQRGIAKFGWFQFNFEHMRMPELNNLYDTKLRSHLRRVLSSDPSGRTIIVLMGDHGPRGQCDDTNPGLWLVVGREVLRRNPGLASTLRANRGKLLTMLDVHSTLLGLLGLSPLRPPASGAEPPRYYWRPPSVPASGSSRWSRDECRVGPCDIGAAVLPANRTCEDARIHPLYCGCTGGWQEETVQGSPRRQYIALVVFVIDYMNHIVGHARESCTHPLQLAAIKRTRTRTITSGQLSAYEGVSVPATAQGRQGANQRLQAVELEVEMVQPLQYRLQIILLRRDLVERHRRSLLCEAIIPFQGDSVMCLSQITAMHRYSRYESCTPSYMRPDLCHCPAEATGPPGDGEQGGASASDV